MHLPPSSAQRERAQLVFEDPTEHSELRIASYVTVMRCVDWSKWVRLERTLLEETNTQVLSFVFSHLTKLKTQREDLTADIDRILRHVDFALKDIGRLLQSRTLGGLLK